MDFLLSQEQEILKDSIRNFTNKEIQPLVKASDQVGQWPEEFTEKLAGMDLLGIIIPTEFSGSEFCNVDYVIILEELSKVDPSVGLVVAAHNSLCSNHINLFGNKKQKEKYLTRLASGETVGPARGKASHRRGHLPRVQLPAEPGREPGLREFERRTHNRAPGQHGRSDNAVRYPRDGRGTFAY